MAKSGCYIVSEKGALHVAQIIPLGFVTATNAALTANVPAPSGLPLRCNKVLVQAFKTATSSDSVFVGLKGLNKTTGAGVIAVLQAGQSVVVGDERDSNVLDPTAFAVDSSSGAAVVTGMLYQR
jgi:hypothetical protein